MAYGHNRSITIDHTKVSTNDQANFVLLFSGTYSYLATVANSGFVTSSSGFDIIFTSDSAGLTVLDFEIDSYDAVTGKVSFWVRVPSVSHTVDTVIYLWYGNAAITTSQENIAGLWPASRYGQVYHFGNNTSSFVGTSSGTPINSTLITSGVVSGTTSGKIGSAASFTPVSIAYFPGGGSPSSNNLRTMSVWFKMTTSSPSGYQMLCGWGNWSFGGGTWDIFYSQVDAGIIMVLGGLNQPWPWTPDTNWHRVTAVMNAANSANVQLYMDGVAMTSSGLGSLGLNTVDGSGLFSVGGAAQVTNYYFDGLIDEVRSEVGAKTVDWILTEYRNQNDPASFYSIGADGGFTPLTLTITDSSNAFTDSFSESHIGYGVKRIEIGESSVDKVWDGSNLVFLTSDATNVLALSDASTRLYTYLKSISDTLVLSDAVSAANNNIALSFSDLLTLADSINNSTIQNLFLALIDSFTLTDSSSFNPVIISNPREVRNNGNNTFIGQCSVVFKDYSAGSETTPGTCTIDFYNVIP